MEKNSHDYVRMFLTILLIALLSGAVYEIFSFISKSIFSPASEIGKQEDKDLHLIGGFVMFAISLVVIPLVSFAFRFFLKKIDAYGIKGYLILSLIPFALSLAPVYFLAGMTANSFSNSPVQILEFIPTLFAAPMFYWMYFRRLGI